MILQPVMPVSSIPIIMLPDDAPGVSAAEHGSHIQLMMDSKVFKNVVCSQSKKSLPIGHELQVYWAKDVRCDASNK